MKAIARAGLVASLFPFLTANAAVIAVIDSGIDYKHPSLSSRMWTNPEEIPGNGLDDDGDAYIDDVYGWNFAENNGEIIDYKYLGTFSDDAPRFFEIQKRVLEGTATDADRAWVKERLADKKFIKELQVFGNFVHGTHVGGIAAGDNPTARLMALKLIPTEVKLPFGGATEDWGGTKPLPNLGDFARDFAVKQLLAQLAKAQGTIFATVGSYAKGQGADVANLSLGTSTAAASMIVEPLLKLLYGKNRQPTPAEVEKYASHFVNKMVTEVSKMARTSPSTLFVIAAGNDGTDNDRLPVAPANLREPNTLTVAATFGGTALAPFSNYGATMVDVAAPGVGITSAIPGDSTMVLSGTSQAAPFVAQVAGLVLDANENLEPTQVREILMGTVDTKDFLTGKVVSGGMVNSERAVRAAALAKEGTPLAEAIRRSRMEIAQAQYETRLERLPKEAFFVMPLPSTFRGQKE